MIGSHQLNRTVCIYLKKKQGVIRGLTLNNYSRDPMTGQGIGHCATNIAFFNAAS